jgi:hypothetical protein
MADIHLSLNCPSLRSVLLSDRIFKYSGKQGGIQYIVTIQQEKKNSFLRSQCTLLEVELNFIHMEMFFVAAFKQKILNVHVKVALVLN